MIPWFKVGSLIFRNSHGLNVEALVVNYRDIDTSMGKGEYEIYYLDSEYFGTVERQPVWFIENYFSLLEKS